MLDGVDVSVVVPPEWTWWPAVLLIPYCVIPLLVVVAAAVGLSADDGRAQRAHVVLDLLVQMLRALYWRRQ